mmetsp:Transcript_31869/g.84212  ORF Transcript_31869/g.84212 Transcript_31869/m.84212 type:complete len:226 (+) Transcript_31869:204-881(+)
MAGRSVAIISRLQRAARRRQAAGGGRVSRRSQRLRLPQLVDQLIALHEASEAALRARREPADPLAADEDVRQRALPVQLAQLDARRGGFRPEEEPLGAELDILELAAGRLEDSDRLAGEGRQRVRVDDARCRVDRRRDVGLDLLGVIRAQIERKSLQVSLEREDRAEKRHALSRRDDRRAGLLDLDRRRRLWRGDEVAEGLLDAAEVRLFEVREILLEKLGHHDR